MRSTVLALASVCLLACGYETPPEAPLPGSKDPLSYGSDVYDQGCAGCHGQKGEGTEGRPPVVGHGALPVDPPASAKQRKGKFEKIGDVAAFIQSDMPPLAPGSLSDREVLAVTLYLMRENGAKITSLDPKYKEAPVPR